MKKWLMVSLVLMALMLSLGGCGVSGEAYQEVVDDWGEALVEVEQLTSVNTQLSTSLENAETENARLTEALADVETENARLTEALADEREKQHTGYFASKTQLEKWLGENKSFQTSIYTSLYEDYELAKELQKKALQEGYIINVYFWEVDDGLRVCCDAYLSNGDIYYWEIIDLSYVIWYGNMESGSGA